MSSRVRKALHERRRQLASALASGLLDGSDDDVERVTARLQAIDLALASLPASRWRSVAGPVLVGVVCILVVWAAWSVTIDTLGLDTSIKLEIDSASIEFDLAAGWQWSGALQLADGRFHVERAAVSFSNPGQAFADLPHDAHVDVEADRATLQSIELAADTSLGVERSDGGTVAVFLRNGEAAGMVLLEGDVTLQWRVAEDAPVEERRLRAPVPEEVAFRVGPTQPVPARVLFQPAETLTLRDLQVSGMRFSREAGIEAGFVSTIRDGKLLIPGVAESYDVSVGDRLVLEAVEGHVRQLQISEADDLVLHFDGTAERIVLGQPGRQLDVTPNVLAHLYHNRRLAFLFGAASFVWGVLWSLHRLVGA